MCPLIGLLNKEEQNASVIVDEIFSSPESMAESSLRNWRWQWFYEHKDCCHGKDYDDIRKLDSDLPDNLQDAVQAGIFRTGRIKFGAFCKK